MYFVDEFYGVYIFHTQTNLYLLFLTPTAVPCFAINSLLMRFFIFTIIFSWEMLYKKNRHESIFP